MKDQNETRTLSFLPEDGDLNKYHFSIHTLNGFNTVTTNLPEFAVLMCINEPTPFNLWIDGEKVVVNELP